MKQKRNNHLLLCVIFIEGRCGLTIEQRMPYVQHAFIHRQGMIFLVDALYVTPFIQWKVANFGGCISHFSGL